MTPAFRIGAAALALLTASCAGLDDLARGDLTVPPDVVLAAGASADPALDAPLNQILALRAHGGLTAMDDERVIQAIRAQAERRSASAAPWLALLVLDPAPEIQIQALAALEAIAAPGGAGTAASAATGASRAGTQEQGYHTFSALTNVKVNYLDERRLQAIRAAR